MCVSVVAVERLGFREEEYRAAHRVRAIELSGGLVVEGARAPWGARGRRKEGGGRGREELE